MRKIEPMRLAEYLRQSNKVIVSCPTLNYSKEVSKQDKLLMIDFLEQDVKPDAVYAAHFSKSYKEIVIEVQ